MIPPSPAPRPSATTGLLTCTETELLDKLDDGDPEALAELYRRHGALVFAMADRVGGASIAAETTRAVFLQLWAEPGAFREGDACLRTWLLTRAHAHAVGLLPGPTGPAKDSRSCDNSAASLSDLPEIESRVLALVVFGGCTFREAATLLDEPEAEVRTWAVEGFRRLSTTQDLRALDRQT